MHKIIVTFIVMIISLLIGCRERERTFSENNINIILESFPYEFDLQKRTCRIITAFDSVTSKFELKNSEIEAINDAYLKSKISKMPDSLVLGNECMRLPYIPTTLKIEDPVQSRFYEIDMDCKSKNRYEKRLRSFISSILDIVLEKKEIKIMKKPEAISM